MNTFDLSLDLSKSRNVNPIRLRQGDLNGTTIRALIFDHGALADLSGTAARWVMRLPGGEEYYRKAATVDATACTVTVEVDETQAASVPGRCRGYFQILDGTTVIASTGDVLVEVLPDALEGASVAESYDTAIQDAIDALDAAIEAIPDTVEDVLEAHPEWTTTVQDGAVTDAKLYQGAGGILARNARLMHRLDNLLTNALPEGDSATATDAAKTPLAGLSLYGRSTQDGTPTPSAPVAIESVGGNLLPNNGTSQTVSGITFTVNADGSVTCSGTSTSSGAVHFNIVNGRGTEKMRLPDGTYTLWAWQDGTGVSNTYLSLMKESAYVAQDVLRVVGSNGCSVAAIKGYDYDAIHVGFFIAAGATVSATIRFALFAGDQSMCGGYVPYGFAGLWARGGNLYRQTLYAAGTSRTTAGISVTQNADGTCTASGTATANAWMWGGGSSADTRLYVPLTAGTYVVCGSHSVAAQKMVEGVVSSLVAQTAGSATFTLTEETLVKVAPVIPNGTTVTSATVWVALYLGTAARAFVPYAESVTPIDLDGHELRSLPDGTRDELTVGADGRVTLVQRVGHRVFDGSSNEQWSPTNNGETWAITAANVGAAAQSGLNLRCDKLSPNMMTLANMPAWTTKITDAWYCKTDGITTMADWRAWLASNPLTLDYALATPVTHDLRYVAAVPLVGPDLTAQAVPVAPFALTYERDLNVTLARLEAALAALA